MERIGETVERVMQGLGAKRKSKSGPDFEGWLKKTLTKKELKHIKFHYFKQGMVNISVDSSGWLYQLSLKKRQILANLSRNSAAIKDIRFRLGEIK